MKNNMLKNVNSPPVLFKIFNRPSLTQRVFNEIRKAEPKKLFVSADGPREGNEKDIINCQKAREIINQVDWDCEVSTKFRESNLGSRKAIISGMNWFFESVDEGIILEDDDIASESFFSFCKELLEKYRFDDKVMQINGCFYLGDLKSFDESYYFSKLSSSWGWATWKQSWEHFDSEMTGYEDMKKNKEIEKYFENMEISKWMISYFDEANMPSPRTWAQTWSYAIMKNNGLCVNPTTHMVTNIGFIDDAASETPEAYSIYSNYKIENMNHINHPETVSYDVTNDELHFMNIIKKSDYRLIHSKLELFFHKVKSKFRLMFEGRYTNSNFWINYFKPKI